MQKVFKVVSIRCQSYTFSLILFQIKAQIKVEVSSKIDFQDITPESCDMLELGRVLLWTFFVNEIEDQPALFMTYCPVEGFTVVLI
jgi:hypothetical protein